MSNIICKPIGVKFSKEIASFEVIFEEPYYIGVAYTDGKQIHIKKFKDGLKNASIEDGWKELENLTDYAFVTFFENKRRKQIERSLDNLCPVGLGDAAYVAAGEVLSLGKKTKKQFTDVFYFKQFALDSMEKLCPSTFFSYQGRWLMHRLIPRESAMAFLSKTGQFSIINGGSGYQFNKMWYFDTDCVKTEK